jgi:hypothetical protein
VAQALYQTLVEFGIISPDGRPAPRPTAGETVTEAAAPAEASKLWTPDAPAPAAEKKKSALWTPDA